MDILLIIGLLFVFVGAIFTGLIAQRGIPKNEDMIRAPRYKIMITGWGFIIIGTLLQLISAITK